MDLESFYLDYNATSPLSPSVTDWLRSGGLLFANPSSQHSSGKASRKAINSARSEIYSTFNKTDQECRLVFHSGATEAFNTIAYSFSEMARLKGAELLICISKTDHPCVALLQEKYFGSHVKFLELKKNSDLTYDFDQNIEMIKDKKDNNPELIILYHHLWVHNETGLVSPLEELANVKKISDLYIHVDAVQAVGKIGEWQKLSAGDIWTFSGHKFGALKGIGFTFIKKQIPFYPLLIGGGQQQGLRPGTENPQGVSSISLALGDMKKIDVMKTKNIRSELASFMTNELQGIGKIIDPTRSNSNTIYFYFEHLSSDIALALFDQNGLEISAGSACSSGASKSSDVLIHMGLIPVAKNGLRLSFSFDMGQSQILKIQHKLSALFQKVRSQIK